MALSITSGKDGPLLFQHFCDRVPGLELDKLNKNIVECEQCPRLRAHCLETARIKRKSFSEETYWGLPIHGFGDPQAQVWVVGLAPAAHGANRTGRIFTGDRSGEWLYRALHRAGFANQPQSLHLNDGLELKNAYVTCVVRCAPPDNKPLPEEEERCARFLQTEFELLREVRVLIALGEIAYKRVWKQLGSSAKRPKFQHGAQIALPETDSKGGRLLILSYHPSQQNTFTGRLTEPQFDSVFEKASAFLRN